MNEQRSAAGDGSLLNAMSGFSYRRTACCPFNPIREAMNIACTPEGMPLRDGRQPSLPADFSTKAHSSSPYFARHSL